MFSTSIDDADVQSFGCKISIASCGNPWTWQWKLEVSNLRSVLPCLVALRECFFFFFSGHFWGSWWVLACQACGRLGRHESKSLGLIEVQGDPGGGLLSKIFWQTLRQLKREKQYPTNAVYTENGELLPSTGDIVGWWKEYFENLNATDMPFLWKKGKIKKEEAENPEGDTFITQAEVS